MTKLLWTFEDISLENSKKKKKKTKAKAPEWMEEKK